MRTWAQPTSRFLILGALVALTTLGLTKGGRTVQDKVKFVLKADAGSISRYQSESKLSLDVTGDKFEIDSKEVVSVLIKTVDKDGTIHREKKIESRKQEMDGEEIPQSEELGKITRKSAVAADGQPLSHESDDPHPDTENKGLSERVWLAKTVIFSPNPVGVGESWTIATKSIEKYNFPESKSTFTLVAFEELTGIKCGKIKQVYDEIGGEHPMHAENVYWVEVSTGDTLKSEFKLSNFIIHNGKQTANAVSTGTDTRISGSPVTQTQAQKEADKAAADKAKDAEGSIDVKVKDFEKMPGAMTLYKKVKEGRTILYLEVPDALLDKNIMLQTTFASGSGDGRAVPGDPISDQVFQFRKMPNDKVFIVVPNFQFTANKDLPVRRAIERSFPEAYLESFSIEATQKDRKSILLDVSNFFIGDISGVGAAFSGKGGLFGGGPGSMGMDREKTFISSIKNFPKNLMVQTTYSFMGGRGVGPTKTLADARGLVVKVDYNLFPLPAEDGYKPRLYDSRVGFFTTDHLDFSSDKREELTKQLILRWNLVKKDPTKSVSEPTQPIVMWLDNAIPTEYREPIKEGILNWNKALLAAGFKDAIQVNQMPDVADFDPADMSHNVVRWVVSPDNAYAVSLFRPNPLTGEILNANITVDGGITKFANVEYGFFVDPARFLSMFDQEQPAVKSSKYACSFAQDAMPNAAMGYLAVNMLAGQVPGLTPHLYVGQFIKEVVCHEMGHILGLRHNFAASNALSLEQLSSKEITQREGDASSVMDYLPFNISALRGKGATFFSQTVGKYDIWAIQYGYTPLTARTPEGEMSFLRNWASRTNEPGLRYLSDEFADGFDPYVTRFDSSSDPLAYWQKVMEVDRYLLFKLGDYSPQNGDSFYTFTRNFDVLLGGYSRAASQATRFIGGVRRNPNYKGDAGQMMPFRPVPVAEQRRALSILNTYLFAENAFSFPKRYYQMFTSNPTGTGIEGLLAGLADYPVQDRFAGIQSAALKSIFSPSTLRRLVNQEFATSDPSQVLRIADLFQSTSQTVWANANAGKEIDPLRRELQRTYIDVMIGIMLGRQAGPDEARSMAYGELTHIKSILIAAIPRAKGTYTPNHLRESLARIVRALEARESIGGSGPAPSSLLDLLLGGKKPPQ